MCNSTCHVHVNPPLWHIEALALDKGDYIHTVEVQRIHTATSTKYTQWLNLHTHTQTKTRKVSQYPSGLYPFAGRLQVNSLIFKGPGFANDDMDLEGSESNGKLQQRHPQLSLGLSILIPSPSWVRENRSIIPNDVVFLYPAGPKAISHNNHDFERCLFSNTDMDTAHACLVSEFLALVHHARERDISLHRRLADCGLLRYRFLDLLSADVHNTTVCV